MKHKPQRPRQRLQDAAISLADGGDEGSGEPGGLSRPGQRLFSANSVFWVMVLALFGLSIFFTIEVEMRPTAVGATGVVAEPPPPPEPLPPAAPVRPPQGPAR